MRFGDSARVVLKLEWLLLLFIFSQSAFGDEWAAVTTTDLRVKPGSPLDFSIFIGNSASSSSPRIMPSKEGRLVFGNGVEARLNCASLAWSSGTGGFPTHDDADVYVKQLRLHGYNLVRFHYLDAIFMTGRKADFDFDPIQLDRWHYFLAKLKENNIHWIFDGLSSSNGALGGVLPHPWVKRTHDLKLGVYFSDEDRTHWKRLILKLYGSLNPYTGTSPLLDSALLGIVLVNENSLDFYSSRSAGWPSAGLDARFEEWLLARSSFRNVSPSREQGGEAKGTKKISSGRSIESVPNAAERMAFFQDVQIETVVWMTAYLKSLGYTGLFTAYDDSIALSNSKSRNILNWVDMHAYHDHVGDPIPGARNEQSSSIASNLRYIRDAAFTRIYGKPFTLTEYGQPFWNKYRYESGPIVSAYANFQGWGGACLHSWGVLDLAIDPNGPPKKRIIQPYVGGIDPIVRAGETVASYTNLNRPFRPARNNAFVQLNFDELPFQVGASYITQQTSSLALLVGVGLSDKVAPFYAAPYISIDDPVLSSGGVMGKLLGKLHHSSALSDYVLELRKKGALSAKNSTNISRGIFNSDTDELYLDEAEGVFRAVSSTAEILVASKRLTDNYLGVFSVPSMSKNGLVAFLSLDKKELKDSSRVLIVMASDARNTNTEFADVEERVVKALGTYPPTLRRMTADVEAAVNVAETYKLFALKLNGDIGDPIRLERMRGRVRFVLDTGGYSHGPTTFFLLTKS